MERSSGMLSQRRYAILLFVSLAALYALSYFQRTAVPGTIFNQLQSTYGLSAEAVSALGACMVVVYAVFQLLSGMLTDRYGGARVVFCGGVVFCIGVLLFPLSLGILPLMYAARVLVGVGSSVMYLSLLKECDHIFGRKNYSLILGVIYFIGYSGGLFGTLPFAGLCQHYPWQRLLLIIGIISAVFYGIFLIAFRKTPQPPVREGNFSFAPLLEIMKNRYTWMACFCTAVNFSNYFILQSVFGMKFLQDVSGMGSSAASAIIFSLTLICMFTLLGGGILTRMLGNRRKPIVLMAAVIACSYTLLMLLSVYFRLPPVFFAIAYFLSALASGSSGTFVIVVQEVDSAENQTQSAAFMNMCCYLTVAIVSLLIGKLLDSFVDPALFASGKTVVYPREAYLWLFSLLLIPTGISLLFSFCLPETQGKFRR